MGERALSTAVARTRSHEVDVAHDVSPVQRRIAVGTGALPSLAGMPTVSSALPIQMFADAVSAGVHAPVVQLDGTGGGLSAESVHRAAAHGLSGSGGSLPHLAAIQQSFGRHDVSGVTAHVGGRAAEGSAAMGARAYASGNAVAFAASPDLHLAAHEAAHVVQQRGGVQLAGGVGAAGDPYERHADAVADLVTRGESAEALLDEHAPAGGRGAGVQRAVQCWATEPDEAVANRAAVQVMILSARPEELSAIILALQAPRESIGGVVLVQFPGEARTIAIADLDLEPLVVAARARLGAETSSHATPSPPHATASPTTPTGPAVAARHSARSLEDLEHALSSCRSSAECSTIRNALFDGATPRSDGNHHAVISPGINLILAPADYRRAISLAMNRVTELQGLEGDRARFVGPHDPSGAPTGADSGTGGTAAGSTHAESGPEATHSGMDTALWVGEHWGRGAGGLTGAADASVRISEYIRPARELSDRVLADVAAGRLTPPEGARIASAGRSGMREATRARISSRGAAMSRAVEPDGRTLEQLADYYGMRLLRESPELRARFNITTLAETDEATRRALTIMRESEEVSRAIIEGAGRTNAWMNAAAYTSRVVAPVLVGAQIVLGAYRVVTAEEGEHTWTAGHEISGFAGGTMGSVAGGLVVEALAGGAILLGVTVAAPVAIGISILVIGGMTLAGSAAGENIWDTVIDHDDMHRAELEMSRAFEAYRDASAGERIAATMGFSTTLGAGGGFHGLMERDREEAAARRTAPETSGGEAP